jgi:hypothetical protein
VREIGMGHALKEIERTVKTDFNSNIEWEEYMNTVDANVIDLGQAREKLALKQKEEQFKKYLSSLKQEQLQYEANYLMNKAGTDLDQETLLKSALLMEELAKRVSANSATKMSDTISSYAEELRKKTEEEEDQTTH